MKSLYRGLMVAALQCVIVLSLAGKYALDRERLPRVWVKTAPYDPMLPVRGRYVSLRLQVETLADTNLTWTSARLAVVDGRLVATTVKSGDGVLISPTANQTWVINEPVAFFIAEHVKDPSRRAAGEELWVEVSVPSTGAPRPLRLGVKRDGVLKPLDLR